MSKGVAQRFIIVRSLDQVDVRRGVIYTIALKLKAANSFVSS
jgi:hypothetical protein